MKNKLTTKQLCMIGLMAALVFAGSKIEIRLGNMRFHLGNAFCLLSGLFMGGLPGGMASGLGSMFFDLVFYGSGFIGCIVTFVTKFIMGAVCGVFFGSAGRVKVLPRVIAAGVLGEAAYIVSYLIKTYIQNRFVLGIEGTAMKILLYQKLTASSVNAVIAVVLSFFLYAALGPAFKKSGISFNN